MSHINEIKVLYECYVKDKKQGKASYGKLKFDLEQLGRTELQIHDILIEFEDEWKKENLHKEVLRKGQNQIILGILITLTMGTISVLFALKVIHFGNNGFLFYGAVAAGIALSLKGNTTIKSERYRLKRRDFKWEQL